jgi:hypothetical protein
MSESLSASLVLKMSSEGMPLDARGLLDRIDLLENPCDLDLLVFFARHPRTLLASEQLAILLGYEFTQIAASLDVLQRAGLITMSENPLDTGHIFVFTTGDPGAGWLPDLLELASTREGRLALVRALRERSAGNRRRHPRVATTEAGGQPPDPEPAKPAAAQRPVSKRKRSTR